MNFKSFRYLFLDRDGVINRRIYGDYVKNWQQFHFIDGVLEALKYFSSRFDVIVVVTNQQGIGKGMMTHEDLSHLTQRMTAEITASGGRIDALYYCSEIAKGNPFCRKPNVGMALKARKQFPNIRFKESIMVGDSISDMEFGKRLGMQTVFIEEEKQSARQYPKLIDNHFQTLADFASHLEQEPAL